MKTVIKGLPDDLDPDVVHVIRFRELGTTPYEVVAVYDYVPPGTPVEPKPAGPSTTVLAFGDTDDEVEAFALGKVREFFSQDAWLEAVRDYTFHEADQRFGLESQAGGKKYFAHVTVRERTRQHEH